MYLWWSIWCALSVALAPLDLFAQTPDTSPSFTLASSRNFNTRERPAITLIYRGVETLDFRVYKVNDAFAFFEKLRDPHHLGGEKPLVPQERTWLERIALWKSERRSDFRRFVRRQLSAEYREVRRERDDARQVVQRRTVNVNSFAQVPVLNASQLVTSWRELLPPMREAEFRRVPLDVSSPGIYVIEAVNGPLKAYTVVVISDVGLVTKTAPGQLFVFAANRFTGEPLAECRIRVIADQKTVATGTTIGDGTFEANITVNQPDNLVTLAQCAGQTAATDPGAYTIRQPARELAGYIYTDRPVYRPGHTVRFKGVLRWRVREGLALPDRGAVEVTVVDGSEKVLLRERNTVDEFGALNGSFTVPTTAALGYYTVRVASGENAATGSFEVQEYRKPEFDVDVEPASRLMLQGASVNATITARYYFGQPVAGATVKYVVHVQPYYSPQRYDESGGGDEEEHSFEGGDGDQESEGSSRLDNRGTAQISIPLEVDAHGRDYTARIEARVVDASDREVAGAASVNATYGRFLVVVQTDRYVFSPGATAPVNMRAVDYNGAPQPNVTMKVALERIDYRTAAREPTVTVIQQSTATTDSEGRAQAQIPVPQQPGGYRVRAVASSEGREVSDTTYIWVPGRASAPEIDDGDHVLELIADRKAYQPGDVARLVIRGAEFDAPVLVTKEVRHVSFHQVVKTRANEAISVPVTDEDVGDTYVSIAFLKDDRLYRAERRLGVPATRHQLTVTAVADKSILRPGEPGLFTLRVTDASGAPVRAQLSVGLVDEAIYGVRPDDTPNPLRFFYRREYSLVGTSFSRDYPFVGYSGTEQILLTNRRRRPMTLAEFKADRPDRPRVRKDFPDTAFWAGDVTTGTDGTAQVRVEYPDSLTSWRLTVRAITVTTDVGLTTAHTTTTKDLILRVVTPRFLTEGDQVTIPAIVHNYLPGEQAVSLTLSSDGLSQMEGGPAPPPRSLTVTANGQQRSDWQFKADQVRPITVTGRATTSAAGDAIQLSLPVLPAGLQRNAGSSGSILDAAERRIPLTVPSSANAAGRSIRISLAPSLAGTMLGALDYLTSYPWGCTEQTLSSFVPNLVVLRALSQMKIAPAERLQALDRQVGDGLKRLYDYQHDDGGWGWWKTDRNHPFMTAYALEGLLQASDNGVNIDVSRINTARTALQRLFLEYPRALPDLQAYEVYVLARSASHASAPDDQKTFNLGSALDQVWSSRQRMTSSGRALLLMTLDRRKDSRGDTAARELVDAAQTRGDLSWWTADSDPLLDDFVDTSVEASALAIKALAARDPQNPLLERTARWLVLNRTAGGYWVSTKQTALALEGLLAYMTARGERPSPFTADVFVNGTRIATQTFDAKSLVAPNPALIEVPATDGANEVRIVKRGAGALYYDASVRYYDRPAAADRTGSRRLALLRSYALLSPVQRSGRIVYQETPFTGSARAGDLILVRLTAAGSSDWRYLMLEDPIPAGTEPVEREDLYELEQRRAWWYGSQRELRDDRVVYFLSDFTAGRYELTYMLKVTTPGTFRAMPARISPMYVPDVSASSDVMSITITDGGVK